MSGRPVARGSGCELPAGRRTVRFAPDVSPARSAARSCRRTIEGTNGAAMPSTSEEAQARRNHTPAPTMSERGPARASPSGIIAAAPAETSVKTRGLQLRRDAGLERCTYRTVGHRLRDAGQPHRHHNDAEEGKWGEPYGQRRCAHEGDRGERGGHLAAESPHAARSAPPATPPSAKIIVQRRSQRSTRAPTNGPRTTWGRTAASVAIVKTSPEPVFSVSHQTSANWTS